MDIQNLKQLIFADTGNFQGYIDERFIDLAHLFSRLQDARLMADLARAMDRQSR